MSGRRREREDRQEKRGYVIAKDLKAAGPLVPQLQEAGCLKWAAGFADAADVMQWQDSLLVNELTRLRLVKLVPVTQR